jgi:biotin carboxyl carrier protein
VELTGRQTAQAREELAAAQAISRAAPRSARPWRPGRWSAISSAGRPNWRREYATWGWSWRASPSTKQEGRRRLDALVAAAAGERTRLDRLQRAEVASSVGGTVMRVHVAPGRHVAPGETLASATDCRKSFVAAIFSIRHAPRLAPGTPVLLAGDGWEGTRTGRVAQVLPRATEEVEGTYAVPFPPIERREMYVLVEPDWVRADTAPPGGSTGGPCAVGQWVSVTLDDGQGWAGAMRKASARAADAARSVLGSAARWASDAGRSLLHAAQARN